MSLLSVLRNNLTTRPKVVFVYGEKYKNSGSTIMRTFQLAGMYAKKNADVRVLTASATKKFFNSTLVLSKGAIQSLNEAALEKLQSQNNTLIFDLVDSELPDNKAGYCDVLICASQGSYDKEVKRFGRNVVLVDHHVDPRVYNTPDPRIDEVRIGYFGELVNTLVSDTLKQKVEYVHIDTSKKSEDWISRLVDFNVHLCVRNQDVDDSNKPFLKGFTAAHTHAVIIAASNQNDALKWLGEDYPYLIKGSVTEKKILSVIASIEKDFGNSTWQKAVKTVASLRQATQNDVILDQLDTALALSKSKES